jgi:hypothetical protein
MTHGRRTAALLAAVAASFLLSSPAQASSGCDPTQPVVCEQGKVVQIVAAGDNTCALTAQGTVYCWAAGNETRQPVTDFSLLLITIGSILVAGGAGLVLISRP